MVEHQGVVAGQIRLAFYAVDDYDFSFGSRRGRELHGGGESRASEPDNAGGGYGPADVVGREAVGVALTGSCLRLFGVGFYYYRVDVESLRVLYCGQAHYGAADRRMDGRRHEAAGFGHELSAVDVVAFGYDRFRGSADML